MNEGPMARLEAIKSDEAVPSMIFCKLSEGETLRQIAKEWEVPKGPFFEWFTTMHAVLYDAARKVRAEDLALQAMDEALAACSEDVAVRKLRADVALRLASRLDRARYGESVKVEREVLVSVDAGLVGLAGELLKLVSLAPLSLPQERVVETHSERE